jgi:hypothetical protein
MGLEFLTRVRKTSVVSGALVTLIMLVYTGPATAGAFGLGCAWTLVNLRILTLLVRLILKDGKRQNTRIAIVTLIKIPVLYAAGYLLLKSGVLPVMALLSGFVWPLFVVFLKAGGRLVLGLDNTERGLVRGSTGQTEKGTRQ